ncbi:hypothetical protein DNTS_009776 [Danionella cerebrum]|uniref:ZP domain-containing protein n=1 Tax=Danionella cerebrum TaxID=2873325 RepID=A0A553N054_9TELE|nr:hypothetical protein DNTS_009776 [Danionella translucida]
MRELGEPLYVEVRLLDRRDANMRMVLDKCWATAYSEAQGLPQWLFLQHGCPYNDEHHLTTMLPVANSGLSVPSHHRRFVVTMFELLEHAPQMFIHCSTSVCHPSTNESFEADSRTSEYMASEDRNYRTEL